jgi:hypothetical protein
VKNFVLLNFKEKCMRCAFFKEYALKFKISSKKISAGCIAWRDLFLALQGLM